MPPLVLGLPGDNTRANYMEANAAFWRQSVIPMVQRLQRAFEHWLKPAYPTLRFDYDVDRIDALGAERAAEWARVDAATFLSADEKRELLGFAARGPDSGPQTTPCSCQKSPRPQWRAKDIGDGGDAGAELAIQLPEGCAEEWSRAVAQCSEWLALPNPPRGLTGGYSDAYDCARGHISERCGGNGVG